MKFVVRKYIRIVSGAVVEICAYNSPMIRMPRGARTAPTDPEHDARNINAIIRKVARLLNANYTCADHYVTLTYSDEALARLKQGMSAGLSDDAQAAYIYEQACKELEKFIRRCRYACKAAGVELHFVGVTSDRDHLNTVDRRIHHHLVVNGEAIEIVKQAWRNGYVGAPHLYKQKDYKPLAIYMIRQARRIKGKACYKASRNLKQPEVETALSPDVWDVPFYIKATMDHASYACYYLELV